MIYICFLALGLAMDAFAVAMSLCMSTTVRLKVDKFKVIVTFAVFQGIMPIIGYILIIPVIDNYGIIIKLLGFILLMFLGIKVVIEGLKPVKTSCENEKCIADVCNQEICLNSGKKRRISNLTLLTYGVATSIDALLAGLVIHLFNTPIIISSLVICLITAIISFVGVNINIFTRKDFSKKSEIVSGVILIMLALKIIV